MDPELLVIIVALVAASILIPYLKTRRTKALAAVAKRLGLAFDAEDPFELRYLPFALMDRGDKRGAENVMHGSIGGMHVVLFDFWYYEESSDSDGGRSRRYRRFSCITGVIDAACPHLAINRENLLTRIADHVGLRDIEFESEEFNRAYNVKSRDRRFAYAFCDARMMQWLLLARDYSFEVAGAAVLVYRRRARPEHVHVLVDVLKGFRGHVPRVVSDLYPAASGDAR